MTAKRTLSVFTAAAAFGAATVAGGQSAGAQEVTLRLHTFVPSVSSTFKALKRWAETVEAESSGKIAIKMFPSRQLGGKPSELYDQARKGFVDLIWSLPGYTTGRFPRTEVFELPFVGGKPSDVTSQAVWSLYDKWLSKDYTDTHPLVLHAPGPFAFQSHKPIRTLDDLKGLKIRSSSRIVGEIFKVAGATPVGIPGIKMAEAFQRNVIDAVYTAWSIALPTKIVNMASSHTEVLVNQGVLMLVMNKNSYAKLSPALKKVIDANSGAALARTFGAAWAKADVPGKARAKKLGHPIYNFSDADRARWEKLSQPVINGWIADMKKRGIDGDALIKDARAAIARFDK